jgi:hypothetical protein
MTSKKNTKSAVADQAKQLIAGTAKHLASVTQVILEGSTYTPADVTNKLTQIVNVRADVDAAKASTKAKLATETTLMPALRTFMAAYVTYVKAAFGSVPDSLADFGMQPRKVPAPATVEEKAAAAAKRASTRAARKTMGPKQKLEVMGDVTGITLTPVTASTHVAPTAAPATPTATTPPSPSPTATPAPHTTTP